MALRQREAITRPEATGIAGLAPLASVAQLRGVRVFDVGQGDSIAVLGEVDGDVRPVLQLDYGGRERHPFADMAEVDRRMPVDGARLLMLTHWDEDHWCSASKGHSARGAEWLVPRQLTSPRAVLFSAGLESVSCIPEELVGRARRFDTAGDDYLLWEKIGRFAGPFARTEDCNATGVALAVVHRGISGEEAILLPGDAPFDKVGLYRELAARGVLLRAIVAFHHGAGTHWTAATEELLRNWPTPGSLDVVFSCSDPSSYRHPDAGRYRDLLAGATFHRTAERREQGLTQVDLLF